MVLYAIDTKKNTPTIDNLGLTVFG